MSDEELIRAVIDERIAAIREKDAERAVATLAKDIVAFELGPPLALHPEAARDAEGLEAWFATWDGGIDIELRDLVIACDGDIAFARSLNRMRGTKADGTAVDFWMRSTLGFRRTNGVWKIVHGHTSVPFYMDGSFRAARDLQP